MYRPVKDGGDMVQVPRLVFSKLTANGADESRFRVALYVLSQNVAAAKDIAQALRLPQKEVEKALNFWEGAGLLEKEAPVPTQPVLVGRRRMNMQEVAKAGEQDKTLGILLLELQRIFGGIVSESDAAVFATLYMEDKIPADLILTAASFCAAQGKANARYIEKVLLSWQKEGITDCAAADGYLKLQALRQKREEKVAGWMGYAGNPFTLSEKRRIAEWFEEYGYGKEMIETARLAAGEKQNEVRYVAAILKKWYVKGYKNARDVQLAGENYNLRVQSSHKTAPEQDRLMGITEYVPMKPRRKEP